MAPRLGARAEKVARTVLLLLLLLLAGFEDCRCDPVTDALSCPSSGPDNRPRCELDERGRAVAVN